MHRKIKNSIGVILAISSVVLLFSEQALAADFRVVNDPVTGCIMEMTGPIEKGDADKFLAFMTSHGRFHGDPKEYGRVERVHIGSLEIAKRQQRDRNSNSINTRICLHSEGGSLIEALKIAELMSPILGTIVGPNKECYSACAILFLAGRELGEEDNNPVDRHIHKTAKLGFHAPSLNFNSDIRSDVLISQAYASALEAAEKIMAHREILEMPTSLFRYILSTPPSEFFLIDTPGKAIRWNIGIYGFDLPAPLNRTHLLNACLAGEVLEHQLDGKEEGFHAYGVQPHEVIENDSNFGYTQTSDSVEIVIEGYLGEESHDCKLTINITAISQKSSNNIGFMNFTSRSHRHRLSPIFFMPSAERIIEVAKDEKSGATPDIKW